MAEEPAFNSLVNLETLTDEELEELQHQFERLRRRAREGEQPSPQ